jgi:hypothetical protein
MRLIQFYKMRHAVQQWLRYNDTSWKVVSSRPEEVNEYFSIYPSLGPGVYSASNRNEYQKQRNNLTNLQPSISRLPRQFGIHTVSQPYRPPRPVTGIALLYGDVMCYL